MKNLQTMNDELFAKFKDYEIEDPRKVVGGSGPCKAVITYVKFNMGHTYVDFDVFDPVTKEMVRSECGVEWHSCDEGTSSEGWIGFSYDISC